MKCLQFRTDDIWLLKDKYMKKKCRRILPILGLAVCLLSGCRIGGKEYVLRAPKVIEDTSVFRVNNTKTKLPEAMIYLCNYKNLYGSEYGIDLWSYDFGEESLEAYVKDITIDELVRVTCMDLIAEQREMTLDDSEKELVAKAAEAYYASLSEEEITFMGVRQSDVENAYEHYALARKLYSTLTTGVEKEVSDDEARVISIQQIYLTDKENADLVEEKLAAGEDFLAVAGTYNEASNVEITVARGQLPEAVEQIAFDLDNNATSGRIEVDDSYYFIRCLNKFDEKLTEENKEIIRQRREKQQFEDAYAAFTEDAVYKLNEELWDSVTLDGMEDKISTNDFFALYDSYLER